MDKNKLKETLLHMQEELIAELTEKVSTTHSMVDLDEGDTMDPEDFSHQYESGELEELIKIQLRKAKLNKDLLQEMDFSPKSRATDGAFVVTNNLNIIVGFPATPFDFEGYHIVGISKDAPLYPFIEGKSEGATFDYAGRNYEIKNIY